jgi:N-acetylneuraminic acid mutarotase
MHASISRRSVLGSAVAAALIPALDSTSLGSVVGKSKAASLLPAGSGAPRSHHTSTALPDGRVLLVGGYGSSDALIPMRSVELFDPSTGTWSVGASLHVPRARHAAALLADGRVVVLGGFLDGPLGSVEIYDPLANQWTLGEPLPMPMHDHAASAVGSQIILSGGAEPRGTWLYSVRSLATSVAP